MKKISECINPETLALGRMIMEASDQEAPAATDAMKRIVDGVFAELGESPEAIRGALVVLTNINGALPLIEKFSPEALPRFLKEIGIRFGFHPATEAAMNTLEGGQVWA